MADTDQGVAPTRAQLHSKVTSPQREYKKMLHLNLLPSLYPRQFVDPLVRDALEQLNKIAVGQEQKIKCLQDSLQAKDALLSATANSIRHKDTFPTEDLDRRTQAIDDAVSKLSLCQKGLESRVTAVEKRLVLELDEDAPSSNLLSKCSAPPEPTCSWEPIFKAANGPGKQETSAQSAKKEGSVARRMASMEKKLGCLQGACLAMEEETSSTTERLQSLEAQVTQHANTVAESYVTIEQLKDVDSRSLSRSAAATANCEERMTSAATAAVRAASDQAQARMESLRDRIQAEIASVQAMVSRLQTQQPASNPVTSELSDVRAAIKDVSNGLKHLAESKADSSLLDARIEGFRKAVEDMKSSVVSSMAEHSSARSDKVQQVLDATKALQSRVEEAEKSHHIACTAASRAEKVASTCTSKLEDLQKLVQALVGGIWGWDADLGRAAHPTKPLQEQVTELSSTVSKSCTEDMFNAIKTLTTQAHDRLDTLYSQLENLGAANTPTTLSTAIQQSIQCAIQDAQRASAAATSDLSDRLSRVEASSSSARPSTAPAVGGAAHTLVATHNTATGLISRPHIECGVPEDSALGVPATRKVAIQRLVEVAISDLEARLVERVLERCSTCDDAVKRLSKRLTAELGGAHAMITSAIHDQSSATEALRSDVTSRIQDDAAAALEAREGLRSSVEAIKQQLSQIFGTLDRCISADTAQGIATREAAALIAADETDREKRNEDKLQGWLEKIGAQIDQKVDKDSMQEAVAAASTRAQQCLDTTADALENAVNCASSALRKELQSTTSDVANAQAALAKRVSCVEGELSKVPTASQVKTLEAALADKAERSDMLTAVSSLQATIGQKMDRAEADAALARKLDVRTFLASQSSVPGLDSLALGSHPGTNGGQTGSQTAPKPPQLSLTHPPTAADATPADTANAGSWAAGHNHVGANNDTSALFTPGSSRSDGRAASPHYPGPADAEISTYSTFQGTKTGLDTPTFGGNHQHHHSQQHMHTGHGPGASNNNSASHTTQHSAVSVAAAHPSASRQNITPAIGLNRPTLKSGDLGGSSYTSAGGFDFADCIGAERPSEVSTGALPPSLRRPPSGLGGNLYSTVATGGLAGSGAHQAGNLGPSRTGDVSDHNAARGSGALQHLSLGSAESWRERPGTPSSATHANNASGKLGCSSTPLDSQSQGKGASIHSPTMVSPLSQTGPPPDTIGTDISLCSHPHSSQPPPSHSFCYSMHRHGSVL